VVKKVERRRQHRDCAQSLIVEDAISSLRARFVGEDTRDDDLLRGPGVALGVRRNGNEP